MSETGKIFPTWQPFEAINALPGPRVSTPVVNDLVSSRHLQTKGLRVSARTGVGDEQREPYPSPQHRLDRGDLCAHN